jgi:predicted transcriptional regulator
MQKVVLLSIRPEFVDKIFSGIKRYEFRRVLFKANPVRKIVIYASSPIQKVVGEFEVGGILSMDTEHLWEKTHEFSGIDKDHFDEYFVGKSVGHAIKIKKVKRYRQPRDLKEMCNVERPPQSFAYVNT